MNAVIYARFSSDNQREESITAQLRICRAYCRRKGYTVVQEYCDEAFTATNDRRPAYQQMFRDAKKGGFNVAVFHKVNRNARNEYDYYFNKMKLLRWGVTIEYAGQSIDMDTPEGQLMENNLVGMAAYFSRNLAKEVKKGQHENALACVHNGGTPPLGYNVGPDKKYIVNDIEAPIVRLIFSMYAKGATYGEIQSACNERGYKTKRGAFFGKNSIHDLLRNKKYIGIYVYGKTTGGKMRPRNSHHTASDVMEIPGGMPAIIDSKTWGLAQERLAGRIHSRGSMHSKAMYLLSGLITCGECGSSLVGNRYMGTHRSLGKKLYSYYQCSRSLNTNVKCRIKTMKKEWIESLVISYVKETISTPKKITAVVNAINEKIRREKKHNNSELNALQREEMSLQKKIENLLQIIETGEISDVIRDRIKFNKFRLDEISSRIIQINAAADTQLDSKQVRTVLNIWNDTDDEEGLRSMLETFVKKVTVHSDHISIELYLDVGGQKYESDNLNADFTKKEMIKKYHDAN